MDRGECQQVRTLGSSGSGVGESRQSTSVHGRTCHRVGPDRSGKLRDIARKVGARNWGDLRKRVAEQRVRHDWRKTVADGLNSKRMASDTANIFRLAAVEVALKREKRRYANFNVLRGGEVTQPVLTPLELRDARRATRTRYQLAVVIVCYVLAAQLIRYLPSFEVSPFTGTIIGVIVIAVIDRLWPSWKWYYPLSIIWVVIGSGYGLMVYGMAATTVRLIGRDNAGRPMRWIAFALVHHRFSFRSARLVARRAALTSDIDRQRPHSVPLAAWLQLFGPSVLLTRWPCRSFR
ncbi:hypothetical protein CLV71_13416 [Actinophytocola oryzae]|uniref:Uncharacterized protein n=1 Tax=Actinophytocola oryzae TaxID=502181 RepID=A0A4R7US61_9PSEU|nr:hypothetical protein CLV71_13416 [Actinophytocola oryzae]